MQQNRNECEACTRASNVGQLSGSNFSVNIEMLIIRVTWKVKKKIIEENFMFLEIFLIPLADTKKLHFIFLPDFSETALERPPMSWGIRWVLALWSISPGTSWMHRTANLVILW